MAFKPTRSGAPKNKKGAAAGAKKSRWTAADRDKRDKAISKQAKIRGKFVPEFADADDRRPARRGERPRFEREDRARFDRDDRPRKSWDREDRPRFDRDDRPRKSWDRDDRPRKSFDREDRPRFDRDDRPRKSWDREDRPRFDRDDRPRKSWDRDDRPRKSFDREDRPRFDRDDRPRKSWDREDRPRFDRDDRPRKSWDREDRPRFDRDDRPRKSWDRDDRPRKSFDRDDRPRKPWDRDDRRGGFNDRRAGDRAERFERRGFGRDDRHEAPDVDADQMSWEQAENVVEGSDATKFADMGLPKPIVRVLSGQGISEPFPIQEITIADALAGKDVLGRAETGSGKTLGFGLPLLARLDQSRGGHLPRGLIMAPTRELAVQVADALSPLAAAVGLKVALVAGGMSYGPQRKAFERGVDVVVATPGRLIDLMDSDVVDLSEVEVTVLDEADHMSDLGFLPDVRRILDSTPPTGQRMLFSATLDNAVATVVKEYLHDPVVHEVDSGQATVSTMTHHTFLVAAWDKAAVAAQIANRDGRTIVFVRTQRGADRVAGQLRDHGIMAAAIHGGQTQGMRVRTLAAFKKKTIPVLVATDVAARGIHVDDVSLVLQMDPPANTKDYLHRAGRTARAGADGQVVTLALPHQRKMVARMLKDGGIDISPRQIESGTDLLEELTGGAKPEGTPIDDDELTALLAPPAPVRKPKGAWNRGPRRPRGGKRY